MIKSISICLVFLSSYIWSGLVYSSQVTVGGELLDNYCTDLFGMIKVRIENNTDEWIKVDKVDVSFGSEDIDKKVEIVSGGKLTAWNDAIRVRASESNFSTRLMLGAIGALGGGALKNSNLSNGVALGAVSAFTANEVSTSWSNIQSRNVFPRTHLLNGVTLLPPPGFLLTGGF